MVWVLCWNAHPSDVIMGYLTVNGELSFSFPEGFRVLPEQEMDALYSDRNHNRAGIIDDEKQAIVSVFWHKAGAFVSKLAGAKDICRATENKIRRRMADHGYVFEGFFERSVCGLNAYGFRHRYVRQGTEYTSEIIVLKRDRTTYTVYSYVGTERGEIDSQVVRDIVDSMRFL